MPRCRALAAHLVETPTVTVSLVAPFQDESALFIVIVPRTFFVDGLAVRETRHPVAVGLRPSAVGQVLNEDRGKILDVHGTTGHVDEVADTRNRTPYAESAGGVRAAADQPPSHAQAPMAIVFMAEPHTSRMMLVAGRPPTAQ